MATTTETTTPKISSLGTYTSGLSKGSSTTTTTKTQTDSDKTTTAMKGLGDNFETFLTMLTTQMKNQDPLKPLDTNDMTKQLVDFANVEQNIGTNSRLDKLVQLQSAGTASTNLAYLGRTVAFQGDTFQYTEGMTQTPLGYEMETSAKSVRVDILDAKGNIVRSMKGDTSAGTKHAVSWDFKDDAGRAVQPGTYRLNVAPVSENGKDTIKTTTYTFGSVSGIGNDKSGETVLNVNGSEVPLSKLTMVY